MKLFNKNMRLGVGKITFIVLLLSISFYKSVSASNHWVEDFYRPASNTLECDSETNHTFWFRNDTNDPNYYHKKIIKTFNIYFDDAYDQNADIRGSETEIDRKMQCSRANNYDCTNGENINQAAHIKVNTYYNQSLKKLSWAYGQTDGNDQADYTTWKPVLPDVNAEDTNGNGTNQDERTLAEAIEFYAIPDIISGSKVKTWAEVEFKNYWINKDTGEASWDNWQWARIRYDETTFICEEEPEPPAPFIQKSTSTASPVPPGNYIKYKLHFGNSSPDSAITGTIQVKDTLDTSVFDISSIQYLNESGYTHSISGSTITWQSSQGLAKNSQKDIEFQVRVKAQPSKCDLKNKAQLITSAGSPWSNEVPHTLVCQPEPEISKSTTTLSPLNPGQDVFYKIRFANHSSTTDITGPVIISDALDTTVFDPTTATPINTPSGYVFNRNNATITWTNSNKLPTNTQLSIDFKVKVKATPLNCRVENRATLDGGNISPLTSNPVSHNLNCEPEPFITKSTSTFSPVNPGNEITYQIRFGNTSSTIDISGPVVVSDTLDSNVFDVATVDDINTPSGYIFSRNGNRLTWTNQNKLPKNISLTIDFKVKVKSNPTVCRVENRATLDGGNINPLTSNSVSHTLTCQPIPFITKSTSTFTPVNRGQEINYTLRFGNSSPNTDITGQIVVSDTLNSSVFDVSTAQSLNAPDGYTFNRNGNLLTWTSLASGQNSGLPQGSNKTINFKVNLKTNPSACQVENKAILDGTNIDPPLESNIVRHEINCGCTSLQVRFCPPGEGLDEPIQCNGSADVHFLVTPSGGFDGNFHYNTENGGYFKRDGSNSRLTDLITPDKSIRYFPDFDSNATIEAVGFEDVCNYEKRFLCEDLDGTTETFTLNTANTLSIDLDPFDPFQDEQRQNYNYYSDPQITWTTDGAGCFVKRPADPDLGIPEECVNTLEDSSKTTVTFRASTNDTQVTVSEATNRLNRETMEYTCRDTFSAEGLEFQCTSLTLVAPNPLLAETYNQETPLLLSISNLTGQGDTSQAEFLWKTTAVNPKFFAIDNQGRETEMTANEQGEYLTQTLRVRFEGTLRAGDTISVREKTDSGPEDQYQCDKIVTAVTPPQDFCTDLRANLVQDPQTHKYLLTANQSREINLTMDATQNFSPNLQILPQDVGAHFTLCPVQDQNPFTFCYNYDGALAEGADILISENGAENPEGACAINIVTTGAPPSDCRSFTPSRSSISIHEAIPVPFKIGIDKTADYDVNFDITPAVNVTLKQCNPSETDCDFEYRGGLADGDKITIKDTIDISCKAEIRITDGDGAACNSYTPSVTSIDEGDTDETIIVAISKDLDYIIAPTLDPSDTDIIEKQGECRNTDSNLAICIFKYKGGLSRGQNITIYDAGAQANCRAVIQITGGGGGDQCYSYSSTLTEIQDTARTPLTIPININKDAGFIIDPKTTPSDTNIIALENCQNTDNINASCTFTYKGGLVRGQNITIYDNNDAACTMTIPITGFGQNVCDLTVSDANTGQEIPYILPHSQIRVKADPTYILNNQIDWEITVGAGNFYTDGGPTSISTFSDPVEVDVFTDARQGTLHLRALTADGSGIACEKQIPIYPEERICESIQIDPSEDILPTIPITEPEPMKLYFTSDPVVNSSRVAWFFSPSNIGDILSPNPNSLEPSVTFITHNRPPQNDENTIGYLNVVHLDDPTCFDQRPITARIIPPEEFNDKLEKSTNQSIIDVQSLKNGLDVINYRIDYSITVQPNIVTTVRFIDTISDNVQEINGITYFKNYGELLGSYRNPATGKFDKLVYGGAEQYTIEVTDADGSILEITPVACPRATPCYENTLNTPEVGVTFNNLPSNTTKIIIDYRMFAYKNNITLDCEDETDSICGETFINTATRIIAGFTDLIAQARVAYLCPYILSRNTGDVSFQEPFTYGADVSCLDQDVRNAEGLTLLHRGDEEEPEELPDTGPDPNWWETTVSVCDNTLDPSDPENNNKIIARFSSFICELKTTFLESWKKSVIKVAVGENKERSVRNYNPIPLAGNTLTDLSNIGLGSLPANNPNPKQKTYYFQGNLIIDSTAKINEGAKTIIVENGDLIIQKNITYDPGFQNYEQTDKIPSIAFIVLNGNIYVHPSVNHLAGVYFVQQRPRDLTTGQLLSTGEADQFKQLIINGSVYGNIQPLFKERKYVGTPKFDGGAIVIRFDERVILNTPPALDQFVDLSWIKVAR